jgi:hypothetical protein
LSPPEDQQKHKDGELRLVLYAPLNMSLRVLLSATGGREEESARSFDEVIDNGMIAVAEAVKDSSASP